VKNTMICILNDEPVDAEDGTKKVKKISIKSQNR